MVKAKKQYRVSISAVCILLVSLSIICVIIGCSSKKDKSSAGKSRPAKTGDNISSADKTPKLPKSPNLPLSDANQTAKKTATLREGRVSTDALQREYNIASSSEKKIEVLQFLPDGEIDHDPCAIEMVRTAVADEDGNVALAGIELVRGCNGPQVLPVVAKAMSHSDEEVRQTAVDILSDINDPQTGDLLATAVSDESENIRNSALDIARDKDEQVRFKVYEKGISSSYGDTKEDSVDMLGNMGGHRAVDILIEALQDKDAEFREKVTSAISMLIDKEFGSYEEAKTWWENNKGKYDEDLSLK
ncbi:MAG: HEAT repeat domain-containing protein [Sedimentisphaerales bacterium]|jgi:HEAT repeat protein